MLDTDVLPVVTGFIAKSEAGNITTLGRGGSDLSATTIAAACKASECQVWKDVDGILTADPRLVKAARPVDAVSYNEAAEMAYFGAQVLHPRAMQPCMKTGIPVRVKNSYNPEAVGTGIVPLVGWDSGPVRTITSRRHITMVDIVSNRMMGQAGFLAELFGYCGRRRISVDMVATSEVSVSLTLDANYDTASLKQDLEKLADISVKEDRASITLIGDVARSAEILSRAFAVCQKIGAPVQMVSQGASKVNVSFIVNDSEAPSVVQGLHKEFFE
jgi:aspartate kinase